jgi:RNA polymerase sigma-70 factor (ECF subfamily)
LLRLSGHPGILRVHVNTVGATVHLGRPHFDELEQLVLQSTILDIITQSEHGLRCPRRRGLEIIDSRFQCFLLSANDDEEDPQFVTTAQPVDLFEQERRRLFTLAYGFLGSRTEAEDIVQEAWLRWQKDEAQEKREPAAWLTTVTARLALDHLRSARVRREAYPGVWLPEPVVEAPSAETSILMKSELTLAFLFLLERLGAEERAALVLREVFDHSYREIGEMLGKTEATCRQLVKRGREKVREERPAPGTVDRGEFERVIGSFVAALGSGDEEQLLRLLAPDAVLYGDGGGKTPSIVNPLYGPDRITRFLRGLYRKFPGEFTVKPIQVNGAPALLVLRNGVVHAISCYAIAGGRVSRIFHMLNPEKITRLPSQYTPDRSSAPSEL